MRCSSSKFSRCCLKSAGGVFSEGSDAFTQAEDLRGVRYIADVPGLLSLQSTYSSYLILANPPPAFQVPAYSYSVLRYLDTSVLHGLLYCVVVPRQCRSICLRGVVKFIRNFEHRLTCCCQRRTLKEPLRHITSSSSANMVKLEEGAEPYEVYPTILVLDFG